MAAFNVSRDRSGEAWFRIGRFEVTSTALIALIGAIGIVVAAFAPGLVQALALVPERVFAGEVWRVVTWPFVDGISLWSVLTIVLLWYFGSDLERQVGRRSMMHLLVSMWVIFTVAYLAFGFFASGLATVGLRDIQFIVLLLWIAENPKRPFFFGIPAWIVGVVLLAINVLGYIAGRNFVALLVLVVAFFGSAVAARTVGLLTDTNWLPGAPRPRKAPSAKPSRSQQKAAARQASDAERMDALLEKISAHGIHSLSPGERKELDALRERRRKAR